ncbi:MAG: hypothetical protein MJA27_20665 [Pseudanabaenales cyanobacterium]|nr:hypothetical protein [Pseudanabaenales cyanobacterium]
MKVRWISASILFSLIMGLSLSSCAPIQSLLSGAGPEASQSEDAIQDELGQIQIELPRGWDSDERLHGGAGIQASNEEKDLYLIVLAEDKQPLSQYSLADNSNTYRDLLVQGLENEEQSPTRINSINGNSAMQYEIRGEFEDAKVTYLHTTVVTDTRYYQVVAWTQTDQYARHKSELQKVIRSFREI